MKLIYRIQYLNAGHESDPDQGQVFQRSVQTVNEESLNDRVVNSAESHSQFLHIDELLVPDHRVIPKRLTLKMSLRIEDSGFSP